MTPESVNLAFCCGSRTTPIPKATSAPSVSISRLGPLSWTAKPSSCRSGILLAKKDSEQSHPGVYPKFNFYKNSHFYNSQKEKNMLGKLLLFSAVTYYLHLLYSQKEAAMHGMSDIICDKQYFLTFMIGYEYLQDSILYVCLFFPVIIVGHMVSSWCMT